MNIKKCLTLAALVSLFSQSLLYAEQYKVQVLYEKSFDRDIEVVIFDYYEENGMVKFFPKIVVLSDSSAITVLRKHDDPTVREKRVFPRFKEEIRILSREGKTIATLNSYEDNFYTKTTLWSSKRGEFFAVLQRSWMRTFYDLITYLYLSVKEARGILPAERHEIVRSRYEAEYGKLVQSSLTAYNDRGNIMWKKEPWEIPYDADCWMNVSQKDGSIIYGYGEGEAMIFSFIDSTGNTIENLAEKLPGYLLGPFSFAENWKYIAIGAQKYPTYIYDKLPGRSCEPALILCDSLWNTVWEKSSAEYILDWVIISPKGSYICVGTHTMRGVSPKENSYIKSAPDDGLTSSRGVIYNKKGDFVMNTSWQGYSWREQISPFSANERFFVNKNNNRLFLADIHSKDLLYEKELPHNIVGASVSNGGNVLAITENRVPLEYYKEGRPKSFKFERSAYLFDNHGNIIWKDESYQNSEELFSLGWDKQQPIIGIVDYNRKIIRVIQIVEEK